MSGINDLPERPAHQHVLLVGGAMRSGTTVLHRALCQARNSNPYISESWFLHEIFLMYDKCMARYDVRLQDQFRNQQRFLDIIKIDTEYYLNVVSEKYDHPEVLILKHPELTRHFPLIRKMIPGIKFLVIIRDPRDVIASIKRVNERHREEGVWSPTVNFTTIRQFCAFYSSYYRPILDKQKEMGGDLAIVRYEDAVSDPATIFGQIGAFSGAVYEGEEMKGFDPDSTESQNLNPDVRLQDAFSGAFWSDLYTKELSPESIGGHKKTLTEDEVAEIERLLDKLGRKFKYW